MRLLLLVNEIESKIANGVAHVKSELEAFYSGLHAIYAQERHELESEYLALKHIAERIFNVSNSEEVPPSSSAEAGEHSGSEVSGSDVPAPANITDAEDLTGLSAPVAERVILDQHPAAIVPAPEPVPPALLDAQSMAGVPFGDLSEIHPISDFHPEDHGVDLHKLADDGNPHHGDEGGVEEH